MCFLNLFFISRLPFSLLNWFLSHTGVLTLSFADCILAINKCFLLRQCTLSISCKSIAQFRFVLARAQHLWCCSFSPDTSGSIGKWQPSWWVFFFNLSMNYGKVLDALAWSSSLEFGPQPVNWWRGPSWMSRRVPWITDEETELHVSQSREDECSQMAAVGSCVWTLGP